MLKLWHVALEEMRFHVTQVSYFVSLVLTVGVFAGLGVLPQLQEQVAQSPIAEVETVFTEDESLSVMVGYVDEAGIIAHIPEEQAEFFIPFADEVVATQALEAGEIESYYLIPSDYIETGQITQVSVSPQLIVGTDAVVQGILRANLLAMVENEQVANRLPEPVVLVRSGEPPPTLDFIPAGLPTTQLATAGLIAGLFTYLLNTSGMLLLRALRRESEARVLEMIIASVTPSQLLGGKLLGLSILVLGEASLALSIARLVAGSSGGGITSLPLATILIVLPYLLLGYLAYSGAMLSIAALWPTMAESLQLQFFIRLLTVLPLIGVIFILPDANGSIARGLTLFPVTAPLLMPFRTLITPVPPVEIGLGLLFLLLWAGLLIGLSFRLFRAQSLLSGRVPTPRAIWQALTH